MLGLYLTAVGIHSIAAGHMVYRNYLRGPVLAPVAIAIGVVLLVAGLSMRR
ncbi:MAG TPA: hypothetical protein VLV78_21925 [Thermoanaerobaculia bacterium]|nr:hypothetical protein [Thermoanaerobaculia bacterium]